MNPGMIKKLQKMQRDMVKAQQELEASTFYGSAGGKMVTVEFTGDKKMTNMTIDPEAIETPEDIDMLQDTIIAAVNDCIKKNRTRNRNSNVSIHRWRITWFLLRGDINEIPRCN
jgi:DNA-binding YbaB/EbfC family protein